MSMNSKRFYQLKSPAMHKYLTKLWRKVLTSYKGSHSTQLQHSYINDTVMGRGNMDPLKFKDQRETISLTCKYRKRAIYVTYKL